MSPKLLVSILINNYNYDRFLNAAIDSALNQTYPHVEVIVVDDGSTDNSAEIIRSYGDRIISILKANQGQASAFNIGFEASKGEIICFLDADDIFLPEKVERIVHVFENNPNTAWCFHPLKLVNKEGEEIAPKTYPDKSGVYDIRPYIRRGKLDGTLPFQGTATSGLCFKASLLKQILPMPEEIRITSDDYIKYAALGLSSGFVLLQDLALQRIHGNNAYTLKSDKRQLTSEIFLLTAYWLKVNFPYLVPFTNKIFAYGLGTHSRKPGSHTRFQEVIHEYFSSLTWSERLSVFCRSKLYSIRP